MTKKNVTLAVCVVLLAALLVGAFVLTKKPESIENAGSAEHSPEPKFLTYQGVEYPIKRHLQTVLLIGTDGEEAYEQVTEGLTPFYNYHQADFLLLLVLDNDAKIVELIQINRDTMMDVPWLDVLGNYGGTEYKQLCLAFNYGDGGANSCRNTRNAVSSLLFDAPIESFIQVPMTVIPVANDLVGGVPVTMEEDMTILDPAFVKGATVRLNGTQAEKFVRARMDLPDDTNLARMRRQRIYMDSFQQCAREAINTDSQFVMKVLETMADYLQSDLTAQQLSDLIQKLDTYTVSPITPLEGELVMGEEYYEFYADEAALWETVKNAYCS